MQLRTRFRPSRTESFEGKPSARQTLRESPGPDGPKSNAWLVAEGAFSTQQRLPVATTAVVTIRKSRNIVRAPVQAKLDEGAVEACASNEKGPRIFRIEAVTSQLAAGVPAMPLRGELADLGTEAAAGAPSLKKQIAIDKRPGPLLQLFSAPAVQGTQQDKSPPQAAVPKGQVALLTAMLAGVQPILDDARRARSLMFMGERFESRWLLLAHRADELQAQIDNAMV